MREPDLPLGKEGKREEESHGDNPHLPRSGLVPPAQVPHTCTSTRMRHTHHCLLHLLKISHPSTSLYLHRHPQFPRQLNSLLPSLPKCPLAFSNQLSTPGLRTSAGNTNSIMSSFCGPELSLLKSLPASPHTSTSASDLLSIPSSRHAPSCHRDFAQAATCRALPLFTFYTPLTPPVSLP